jgi:tRNA dimethylallyltransferase
LAKGALNEAKKILNMGFQTSDSGLKTIGYQPLFAYLNHQISLKEAINRWQTAEVQYAKRQETFMKKDKNIIWRQL